MKAFITDALTIHTMPIVSAVVRARWGVAALAGEVREAYTFSIHTLPLIIAIVSTRQLAAVFSCVAIKTHTFPFHTQTVVTALIRAGGHRAI